MKLSIPIDSDKSTRWVEQISEFTQSKSIAHCQLEKLIGKLSFAQTSVFGKFARSLAQPLYDKLHAKSYCDSLSDDIITNLKWWKNALASVRSRVVSVRPKFAHYIIYTDASWSDKKNKGRLAALLFDQRSGVLLDTLSSEVPMELADLFRDSAVIYGLELFALVSAFAVWQDRLSFAQVTAYVDNDPSSDGVIKGSANHPIAQNFIRRFWQLIFLRSISVWVERVPSPRNWADMPTRDVELPVKSLKYREFPNICELINMFCAQWSEDPNFKRFQKNKRSYL